MTALSGVIRDPSGLPADFAVSALPACAGPTGVLLCPPDHFDVVDVKNRHMEGAAGTVDRAAAHAQWAALAGAFRQAGMRVAVVNAVDGCEDMVFCANQTFTGPGPDGAPTCMLSHMRHASRRREVPTFEAWFRGAGYRVIDPVPEAVLCEGGGDLLWHPGRRLIWAGHGFRTSVEAHDAVAAAFGVPVISLALGDDRFYHLDTCLCALDERTALIVPSAFDAAGLALIRGGFERVIEVDDGEAVTALACNAAAFPGGGVVVDERAVGTIRLLEELGKRPIPVDTGEFLKSGGSVFCMKQFLFDAPTG